MTNIDQARYLAVTLQVHKVLVSHFNHCDERSADEGTHCRVHFLFVADIRAGGGPLRHAGLQFAEPTRKLYNEIL